MSGVDNLEQLKILELRGNQLQTTAGIHASSIRSLYLVHQPLDAQLLRF
jgi:hypothetical protein